ncbi:MAG: EAL domain-containing protein [Alteromonadaceae bacterium]|nr:EAL domain-containing protein [Alteromonadaceae bacterium]
MTTADLSSQLASLERRLKREKAARKQAENLLTEKSRELYNTLKISRSAQARLELALWASQEAYWEWHAEHDIVKIRSFGLINKKVQVVEQNAISVMARVHADDLPLVQMRWVLSVHGNEENIEMVFRIRGRGGYRWTRLRGKVLKRDKAGAAIHIMGTAKDTTQEHLAQQSFQLMASAFSSSREPMLVLSNSLVITESNDAFLHLAKVSKVRGENRKLDTFLPKAAQILSKVMTSGQERFETELVAENGTLLPVDVSIAVFKSRQNKSEYLIATLRDISERKLNEQRLQNLVIHDELTGLKNRMGLREELEQLTQQASPYWLAFIDLDGFKNINDVGGHETGDDCLKVVADILKKTYSKEAIVTRWGGDEFLIAQNNVTEDEFKLLGDTLLSQLEAHSFQAGNSELMISASIGLASYPEHGDTVEEIIQHADAAMYKAKTSGKARTFVYHAGLIESLKAQATILSELRRTIRSGGLEFYLQGKFNIAGSVVGAELLCRWFSPVHGFVSPEVFIPLAEANGLDTDIGLLALEAACEYISMMETEHLNLPLAVNISANQLLNESFAQSAADICAASLVSPQMIQIEITESIFIQDEKAAVRGLRALKEHGFVLALDDFGSGFSSLSYLRKFEFDVVKLDRSLVKGIDEAGSARSLMYGIINMLNSIGLDIIIEGIDNVAYLSLLEGYNVAGFQGFLFEKPLPYEQFIHKHTRGWHTV